MNEIENATIDIEEIDENELDFEMLEKQLEEDLVLQEADLNLLKEDFKKIGTPEALGEVTGNVIWEQFINQIGVVAGEDFIKENNNLKLDLRDSAHIQTTENFVKEKIATHNTKIDYQERYDRYIKNFERDSNGNIKTHSTRSGKIEANIKSGARKDFDRGRPVGSLERGTDIDHTISAAEIMRDPSANAHLSREEQISFANSSSNLMEMNSSHNRSKKDTDTQTWLDNPNSKGQTPKEVFSDPMSKEYLSDELEQKYREKDAEAREEFNKRKEEGEKRSIETGKQSKKEEAFRIGGKALRAAIMGLLASLAKEVIQKLIKWLHEGKRKISDFIGSIKEAIKSFFSNIKKHLLDAGSSLTSTILTSVMGPIANTLKKAWIFLKQGYKSLRDAIRFFKDPKNKNLPFSIKILEAGKIIIAGLTAGGAIISSELIEKGLISAAPFFAFEIPMLGSLASLLGIFLGGLISGLIGAFVLNIIDRIISKKQKRLNKEQQFDKKNEIITTSDQLIEVIRNNTQRTKYKTAEEILHRHQQAASFMNKKSNDISDRLEQSEENKNNNRNIFNNIDDMLNILQNE